MEPASGSHVAQEKSKSRRVVTEALPDVAAPPPLPHPAPTTSPLLLQLQLTPRRQGVPSAWKAVP